MRQVCKIRGRNFILHEKSIKVEGLADVIFYGRQVNKKDAELLAQLIVLGRMEELTKIRALLFRTGE